MQKTHNTTEFEEKKFPIDSRSRRGFQSGKYWEPL